MLTQPASTEEEKQLLQKLSATRLISLESTRSFNQLTKGVYKPAVQSALRKLRNNTEEYKKKKREYNEREDVKERNREYNQRPDVKEKRRRRKALTKKVLELTPVDVVHKALEELKKETSVNAEVVAEIKS